MTKLAAEALWECGSCGEVYDDDDDAAQCCQPEVYKRWGCPTCKKVHGHEKAALLCCNPEALTRCPACARDYAPSEINHAAVLVAGHCNTCNPLFTPMQQFAIEDMHIEQNPYSEQSLLR